MAPLKKPASPDITTANRRYSRWEIPSAQIGERIVRSFNTDLRYLMIQDFAKQKTLDVRPLGNWKFVPESIVAPARKKQAEQFR